MLNEILRSAGHSPLQLLPYYPDLISTESIFSEVNGWAASRQVLHNKIQGNIIMDLIGMDNDNDFDHNHENRASDGDGESYGIVEL
jgi:hypothetical protein